MKNNKFNILALSIILILSTIKCSPWIRNGNHLYPEDTAWNVGIGTTDPLVKLHNNGDFITIGPWVDVRGLGASPANNAAENDHAFSNALDSAFYYNRPLYIPAGTWKFNNSFSGLYEMDNLVVFGDGPENTILKHEGRGVAVGFDLSEHVMFKNITINTNENTSVALLVKRCWWGTFSNIYIEGDYPDCDYPEVGVKVLGVGPGGDSQSGAYYNDFRNITIKGANISVQLLTECATDNVNRCNSNTFTNVNATRYKTAGYKLRLAGENLFLNCQIEGGDIGEDGIVLEARAHSNVFIGGFLEGQTNACIHILNEDRIRYNIFIGQRANKGIADYLIQEETFSHVSSNIYIGTYGERTNYMGDLIRLFTPNAHEQKLGFRYFGRDFDCFKIDVNGKLEWGPGGTEDVDIALYRSSINQLVTDSKFIAIDGIGVGNHSSASSEGSIIRKIEVFDQNGNSLGFIPVYDTIE